jgi:hypothetical protein
MWLASSQGSVENFVERVARFVTRPSLSLWDFGLDTLAAIKTRLGRDFSAREALARLATDKDHPSLRASIPGVLLSVPGGLERGRLLAKQFLDDEALREGLPRFGLDISTNRVRLLSEVLRTASGVINGGTMTLGRHSTPSH